MYAGGLSDSQRGDAHGLLCYSVAMKTETQPPVTASAKAHYPILDGLRGVAAVMVVLFHAFEIHGSRTSYILHHAYLAVDFFFLLSGFVIAYAYDDRAEAMGIGGFFRRRLIRLHPMVVFSVLLGVLLLPLQACPLFSKIEGLPLTTLLLGAGMGLLMLPVLPGWDVRGWREMFPLNGPAWSLFYEYLANIVYILLLRRLPNVILGVLAAAAGSLTLHHLLTSEFGDLAGGWTIAEGGEIYMGFLRLTFPFLTGMLLARLAPIRPVRHAFAVCSALLIALFSVPRLGTPSAPWINGLYEAVCVLIVFPLVVWLGACGTLRHSAERKLCTFLGEVSYPLYIIHYPIVYVYMGWVKRNGLTLADSWGGAALTFAIALTAGWLAWRFVDRPARRWLSAHWRG